VEHTTLRPRVSIPDDCRACTKRRKREQKLHSWPPDSLRNKGILFLTRRVQTPGTSANYFSQNFPTPSFSSVCRSDKNTWHNPNTNFFFHVVKPKKTWFVSHHCTHMFHSIQFFSLSYIFANSYFYSNVTRAYDKLVLSILSPCHVNICIITVTHAINDPYIGPKIILLATSNIHVRSFNNLHIESSSRIRFIERLMNRALPFYSAHQWQSSWWGERRSSSSYCMPIDFCRFTSILSPILDRNMDSDLLILTDQFYPNHVDIRAYRLVDIDTNMKILIMQ
jgi:hypothetical protein